MKAKVIPLLIFVVVLSSLARAEDPVVFSDAKLKAAVEATLLISDPTPSDMLALWPSLHAQNKQIQELGGLEYAINLQSLVLRWNNIHDISIISHLSELKSLDLSQNEIEDISPLSNLAKLISLDVHGNKIEQLPSLSGLQHLKTLVLRDNQIENISGLSGINTLEELYLNSNLHIKDLSPLSGLSNLKTLSLQLNKIEDLSPLSGLSQLKVLYLHRNQISDISALTRLNRLTTLRLEGNPLNQAAYRFHLDDIFDKNPGINLLYDFNPELPIGLSASKGLSKQSVYITWQAVPNGPLITTYYRLSRSPEGQGGLKTPISKWQTSLSLEDTNVEPGIIYTYWVQTATSSDGLNESGYSAPDTGWVSMQPSLSLSSSPGGSVVLPGEDIFFYPDGDLVNISAESDYPGMFAFSRWTGTAVDAGRVDEPNQASITVKMDSDYTLRAQFVSLWDTLYVDDDAADRSDATGTQENPLYRIQDAIEVAPEGAVIKVSPGIYYERLKLGDKALDVIGYEPNTSALERFPVIDGNNLGSTISFSGEADCGLSGFMLTGGLAQIGSAIDCYQSSPVVTHCLIVGNRATAPDGGSVYCRDSLARFVNCTIMDNLSGMVLQDSDVQMWNTILWGNINGDLQLVGQSVPVISYCDIGGGWDLSSGNFDTDPLPAQRGIWVASQLSMAAADPFDVNAVWLAGDYHLRSGAGHWEEDTQQWVVDEVTSVCIDGGDPTIGARYEPEPNGEIINIGAFGGTAQASKTSE